MEKLFLSRSIFDSQFHNYLASKSLKFEVIFPQAMYLSFLQRIGMKGLNWSSDSRRLESFKLYNSQ